MRKRLLGNYVRAAEELHIPLRTRDSRLPQKPIFATPNSREFVLNRKEFSSYGDGTVIYEHGTIGGVSVFIYWNGEEE